MRVREAREAGVRERKVKVGRRHSLFHQTKCNNYIQIFSAVVAYSNLMDIFFCVHICDECRAAWNH